MWDVYVLGEDGFFKGNHEPLTILEADHFCALLDKELAFFLFPAGRSLPVGLGRLVADAHLCGRFSNH